MIGLEDLHLGFPNFFEPSHPIDSALDQLQPGDRLALVSSEGGLDLLDARGVRVARLSRKAEVEWAPRLSLIQKIRLLALAQRHAAQETDLDRVARYRLAQ